MTALCAGRGTGISIMQQLLIDDRKKKLKSASVVFFWGRLFHCVAKIVHMQVLTGREKRIAQQEVFRKMTRLSARHPRPLAKTIERRAEIWRPQIW